MVSLLTAMYPIDADMFYHLVDTQCLRGGSRSLRGYFYILLTYMRQRDHPMKRGRFDLAPIGRERKNFYSGSAMVIMNSR